MPAGVRATRSQTISGFCALTSIFAASAMAAGSPCGGIDRREFRNLQVRAFRDWIFLQLGIERDENRPHRRRGRDLVGAGSRLGEMLQRGRLIVPLGELTNDLADVDAGVEPFGARSALVGLHDVTAEHQDRHPIAPGVVHRHGCVLQTDDAVAGHGGRLAGHFGVTLRHMDCDVLVHAGDDFGLVVAVIDDGFVQAAIARSAVDEHVLDAERIDDVGHEVAAARRLIDRVAGRRKALGCNLAAGPAGPILDFSSGAAGIALAATGGSNRSGCADETCTFEEITTICGRRWTALRHRKPPRNGP